MKPAEMSVLELPLNRVVHPFAPARKFEETDLTRIWERGDWGRVLSRPISFWGISGNIELFAHRIPTSEAESTETPLGEAQMVVGFGRDGLVVARKLPLFIMFGFTPKSLYEYRLLEDYRATVHLGLRRYQMPCRPDSIEPEEVQQLLASGQSVRLFDHQLFHELGDPRIVSLPFSLSRVKRLGLSINPKPRDFGAEEALPIPQAPVLLKAA